jgi:hypothetical protein
MFCPKAEDFSANAPARAGSLAAGHLARGPRWASLPFLFRKEIEIFSILS